MACRTRLKMRLYAQRNSASVNPLGHASPPTWGALATIACWAWVTSGDTSHTNELSPDTERVTAIIPKGTDITSDDRVEKITDRLSVQIWGVLQIDAVLPRPDHIELRMRQHT